MIRSDGWTDAAGRPPLINLVAALRWSGAAPPQPAHASGTGATSASSTTRSATTAEAGFGVPVQKGSSSKKPHDSWAGGLCHAEWEDTYSSDEERGSDEDGEYSKSAAPPVRRKNNDVALCRRGEPLPRKGTRFLRDISSQGPDTQIDRHQLHANNNK